MIGLSALSEYAIAEEPGSFEPEGLISVAGPLGAVLLLGAAAAGFVASSGSVLRPPVVTGYLTASGQSAAPAILASALVRASASAGVVSLPGILGDALATGSVSIFAYAAAGHVLAQPRGVAFHDFTATLGDVVTRYVMDLIVAGDPVRVPISSWQATLQTGASCYVQCVVPAALDWSATINAATEFVISRVADAPSGEITYEMARSPLGQVSAARGPTNYTATLSGYADAFAEDEDPDATFDRTLTGIRSTTTGTSPTRVRSAIDWLLRPGQRAYYDDGASFVVRFINYYCMSFPGGGSDSYMDAGE